VGTEQEKSAELGKVREAYTKLMNLVTEGNYAPQLIAALQEVGEQLESIEHPESGEVTEGGTTGPEAPPAQPDANAAAAAANPAGTPA
jgi:hypothetical protein